MPSIAAANERTPTAVGSPALARQSARSAERVRHRRSSAPRRAARPERFGGRFGGVHPAVVFFVVMLAGLAVIAALSIGSGLLVTHVLEHASGIGAADERVNVWLAAHRTPNGRTPRCSARSSPAASCCRSSSARSRSCLRAPAQVAARGVLRVRARRRVGDVPASRRSSSTRTGRRVVRLEHLPVDASYPSGHTAASIAVYGGLALLLTSRSRTAASRVLAWTLAVAMARSSPSRACTAACTTRSTSPAACSSGSRAARASSSPAGGRRGGRATRARRQAEHEGRRHRPRRQDPRRRAARAAARPRGRGRRRPVLVRGAEEPQGAGPGPARARRGRRARLRLGRRRDGPALRRRARRLGREPRDHPGRHREPVRVQSRDPEGHRGGGRDRPARRAPPPRRRPLQRRALRRDGRRRLRRRDDPRRRDGGLKDRFGRAAYVWSGSQNLRVEAVSRRRSKSTASAGTRARRAASCSATSASSSAASRCSRTRAPTTACSSSASSPPRASSSGRA